MSLNGLEALEVNEAYQSALGEGGGWFLLNYISRDEVGLLERGSGGLSEVQEAVNRYEEQSPLFGFIQYRRRKVILKYVPEGTSRLLQARVSVQFQSVAEKLTPHDTIFPFTKVSELQESTLSSACSLHTALSIKSKDSSPHRGLAGITEDASESRAENDRDSIIPDNNEKRDVYIPRKSEDPQTRPGRVNGRASAEHDLSRSPSIATQSTYRPRTTSDTNKALPPPPHGSDLNDIRSSPPHYGDYNTRPSVDERYSSQSARPSTRDLHDAYEYKPKVKLGPRPSMESQRSPDGSHRSNDFRPVASLPAGVRMPSRKVVSGRPVSRQAQGDFHETMSPTVMPPPPPRTPITPIQIPDRKLSTHSNGLPTPLKTPESIAPKMTPEKRRLMKALELRQKQLAAQRLTSGPGNEAVSDKQASDFVRPEVDDVVLNAILEANSSKAEPDLMHIAVRDLSKEEPRNLEVSPISIAETSEGPSTQASSITDEEDTPTHKIQDHTVDSKPSVPDLHGIRQADHDHGHLMSGTETSRASGEAYEYSATNDPPLDKGLENTSQSPERALLGDQHQVEQKSLKTEKSPSMAVVFSEPAKDSLLTQESQETPMVKKEQQGVVQSTSATSCDQYLEEGAHGSLTGDALEESAHSQGKIADSKNVPREQQAQTLGVIALDDSRINRHDSSHHSPLVSSESSDAPANEANARETPRLTSHEEEKAEFAPSQVSTSSTTITEVSQPIADEDMKSTSKPPEPLRAEENAANLAIPALGKEANRRLEERQEMPPTASVPQNLTVEADSSLPPSGSKRQSLASDVTVTQPPSSSAVHERSIKRQGVIKSVERMSSAEQSDEHFLSDDSFMDELHSATVQEAKPVSVSKSPIKPVFPRSESQQRLVDTRASRSVSSPMNAPRNNGEVSPSRRPPTAASVRSFSASHAPRPDEQAPAMPLPKKIGVSSGISQRIKALEQSRQTNRPTSPQSQTSTPSPTAFINLRKNAQRSPPEVTNLNRNQNVHNRPSTAYPSPSPSPDYVKWNPFSQSKKIGATRPDSVSVTATIIRDKTSKTPEMPLNPSEPRTTDLHQSPLVIEHQETKPPPPLSPLKPPRPRYARYSSARSGSSSSTDQTQKLEKPPNSRRDSFASIRSKSSRAGSELELPRSISDSSLGSPGSPDSGKDDRKDSKRSRLMKRMSSISSMSRRSIAHALSPGPKESPILESQEPIAESPLLPSEVEIGDVNVQFPDTLLWKRRHMTIDEKGILVLAASKSDNNSKVVTKRYALSQFCMPYVPDQDRQELPNSVILDFVDGSTLQCACEHPQGQAGVLQALRQAHATWSQ